MYENGFIEYILSEDYKAANTPLPYLLPFLTAKVLNTNSFLVTARVINFIFSFSTIILFFILLKKLNSQYKYSTLFLLFYPYFIKTSFVFYLSIYGLFFLLLSMVYLSGEKSYSKICSGISGSAGILSQQFLLAFPAAFTIWIFIQNRKSSGLKFLQKNLLFYLPFVVPFLLFIYWGGFAHPNWQFHGPEIDATHITATFTIIGGVFFPFLIARIKEIKIIYAVPVLLLALILTIFFTPVWGDYGSQGQVTGYTYNFLYKLNDLSTIMFFIVHTALCFIGIQILFLLLIQKKSNLGKLILITALVFVVIYAFDTVYSERHLLPLISCLFLLIIPQIKNKIILNTWIVYQTIFGLVYYYYWLFVHPSFAH